jgi:hypothetical protein
MSPKSLIKFIIYALVIILSLIVLGLLIVSPPGFTNNKSVYQGF